MREVLKRKEGGVMQGLKIIFKTDPTEEEPHQSWRTETQKRHVNNLLPVLVKNDCPFHFYINCDHQTDPNSLYPELTVHAKHYYGDEIAKVRKSLKGVEHVSFEKYPVCEAPECYERIAGEKIPYPIFDRHGECTSVHPVFEQCEWHLQDPSRQLLATLETIDETPKGKEDHWVCIHVWKWPLFWVAQRVWQMWNYDGWENPNVFPYCVASPWLCAKTKELAITAARDYEE
jgi:hypothetical protein